MARARLQVWDPQGTHQLRTQRGQPAVKVEGVNVPFSHLVDAAATQLGLEVAFLRYADDGDVVMQSLDPDVLLPPGLEWRLVAPGAEWQEAPWSCPGWFGEVLPIIDQALAERGLQRTGAPQQIRHSELAAVLRIPTTRATAWFKMVPPVFACEGAVTEWLTQVASGAVPTVLATGPNWWIASDFPPEADDPEGHPFETLAGIQTATATRTGELLQLGCPYRGLDQLADDLAGLTERPDILEPATLASLRSALPGTEKVCTDVEALGIPYTLVHGDFRSKNVRWTSDGWFLYDWSDTCIAHPFVDTEDRDFASWDTETTILTAMWLQAVAPQSVNRVQQDTRVICAAHRCATFQRIVDSIPRSSAGPMIQLLDGCIHRLAGAVGH